MLKRVLPLLLALAVAGAPAALEACAVACASSMAHPATTDAAHDHPCHDKAAPQGPQVSSPPHACSHGGDLPSTPSVAAAQNTSVVVPLALVVASTTLVAPVRAPMLASAFTARSLDPAGLRLAIPLRI